MTDVTRRSLAGPFRGRAWVCRAAGLASRTAFDLISDKANRWNAEGEPTVYLSGDPALALIETGRHPDDLQERARLFEVDTGIPAAVDVRDQRVVAALALPTDTGWVLDRRRTRDVARSLRRSGVDALIVPSAGALDQRDRFNIVVFADDPARLRRMVTDPRTIGKLAIASDAVSTQPG